MQDKEPRPIAVLDFETDPFDAETEAVVLPFAMGLYWRDPATGAPRYITQWNEDSVELVRFTLDAIEALPGEMVVYAHNGGRFDYMYLMKYLKGKATFKGRGLMCATVGRHELRDSFHIIPTALGAIRKTPFDYNKMKRDVRAEHRDEINSYLFDDCLFLFDAVKAFRERFGEVGSIGGAAINTLKRTHKFEKLSEKLDDMIRPFFFGGRVQCLQGHGIWSRKNRAPLKIFDVNSMYPSVMAAYDHPVSKEFIIRTDGIIRDNTRFIELQCYSAGAFLQREKSGAVNPHHGFGRYFVTIWELLTARRFGLVRNENIIRTLDFKTCANFAGFVRPLYSEREAIKAELDALPKDQRSTEHYFELERRSLFIKLILNNAFGKFAQNPRRFKEIFLTDAGCKYPPGEQAPTENELRTWRLYCYLIDEKIPSDAPLTSEEIALVNSAPEQWWWECDNKDEFHGIKPVTSPFWIWKRPAQRMPHMFNNVATGASITGAARARLLEALTLARNPYYCDTDSVICEDLEGVEIHGSHLGAWKCERQIDELIIGGKKLYGYHDADPDAKEPEKVKSKGVSGLKLSQLRAMVETNETLNVYASKAPLISPTGEQRYIRRKIRMTA